MADTWVSPGLLTTDVASIDPKLSFFTLADPRGCGSRTKDLAALRNSPGLRPLPLTFAHFKCGRSRLPGLHLCTNLTFAHLLAPATLWRYLTGSQEIIGEHGSALRPDRSSRAAGGWKPQGARRAHALPDAPKVSALSRLPLTRDSSCAWIQLQAVQSSRMAPESHMNVFLWGAPCWF